MDQDIAILLQSLAKMIDTMRQQHQFMFEQLTMRMMNQEIQAAKDKENARPNS